MIEQLRQDLRDRTSARDELRATLPESPIDWTPQQLDAYQQTSRAVHRARAALESAKAAETARQEAPAPSGPIAKTSEIRAVIVPDDLLGGWSIGIRAEATVLIPDQNAAGCWTAQRITSPGLWEIDGDADAEYRAQVYRDELATLETMLDQLGVTVIDDKRAAE